MIAAIASADEEVLLNSVCSLNKVRVELCSQKEESRENGAVEEKKTHLKNLQLINQ